MGLVLTSSLDWNVQINEVCLKANRKLSVLRSVKLLSRQTLDILYKIVVRSVIDYALPVYYKTLRQNELQRLENVQYRAAKIVSGALHLTSREKLNKELGWESISERGDFLSTRISGPYGPFEILAPAGGLDLARSARTILKARISQNNQSVLIFLVV